MITFDGWQVIETIEMPNSVMLKVKYAFGELWVAMSPEEYDQLIAEQFNFDSITQGGV